MRSAAVGAAFKDKYFKLFYIKKYADSGTRTNTVFPEGYS